MNNRLPDIPGVQKVHPFGIVLKYALCAVTLLLTAAFQTSFFASSGLFAAVPDLLLTLVAGLALIEGEKCGSVCGIFAGLLAFSLGGTGTMFLPVFYCLEGYIYGVIGRTVFRRNLLSWTVYTVPLVLARSLLSLVYLLIAERIAQFWPVFLGILLPELVLTFLFSYLSYFFAWLILRPFHKKRGKDDPVQLG